MAKTVAPAKPAPRRSQAGRSAETRARILAAAVACVDELGFGRATFQRIARRAGVTVGAVQHHFAAKEDILRAILEDSFERFSRCFEGVSVEGRSLESCVSVFVDRAWLHCSSPTFRSTVEILLTTRGEGAARGRHWTDAPLLESSERARRLWSSVFAAFAIPVEREREILQFAFAALAGIAMTLRLQGSRAATDRQLALLKTSLTGLLEAVAARGRSS
ncbi:MAG: TetR/AcrR family transcriptional regulator [Deltaproteobacteria bacterium]|nr:MAG: TetR/AcrR family transcriptional regulator [Deltaproteobacteria bacterium]